MTAPAYCYRHPDRETGLSCSECGRPICYECMTPAPVGLRCPEHSGKPQGIQKVTRAAERAVTGVGGRRVNAVTIGLIMVNVAVYAAELAAGGDVQGTQNWIFNHGALFISGVIVPGGIAPIDPSFVLPAGIQASGVAHGEWWRMITAAFLHYGPFHLAVNMYSLFFAGTLLEQAIGRWRFALLYLASGVAGSAGAIWVSPNSVGVGASGAIFGILGALFVLERRGHLATGGQIAGLIVINLIITFSLSRYISVGAHVGGLVGGVALMWVLIQYRRSMLVGVLAPLALIVASVALAYAKIRKYQ